MGIMIAPRLRDGRRDSFGSRMDPLVKEGLRAIASKERKSMSWVVEEIVIDYFSLRHSRYLKKRSK